MNIARGREGELERLLGPGLADTAGDGNHRRLLGPRPGRSAEVVQRLQRIAHAQEAFFAAPALEPLLDNGASGILGECRLDEGMAVAVQPAQRQEGLAGRERPAVDGDAADFGAALGGASPARGFHHLADGPERLSHALPQRQALPQQHRGPNRE